MTAVAACVRVVNDRSCGLCVGSKLDRTAVAACEGNTKLTVLIACGGERTTARRHVRNRHDMYDDIETYSSSPRHVCHHHDMF